MGQRTTSGDFKLLSDARHTQRSHRNKFRASPANASFVNRILTICSLAVAALTHKQSIRPFLDAVLNGKAAKFLFDTGSDITVISLKQFRTIPVDKRPTKLNSFQQFKSATSTQLVMHGAYLMDISVFGRTIKQIVYVCENLNQNAIMGMDAIEKLSLNYSVKQKRFFFEDATSSFASAKVVNAKRVILPPLSTASVKVCALTPSSLSPPPNKRSIVTVRAENFPMLQGGPGLVNTNSSNEMFILIHNGSPVQQEIPRGEILGDLENIHNLHVEQIHESDITKTISAIQAKVDKNLPPIKRQQQILSEFLQWNGNITLI